MRRALIIGIVFCATMVAAAGNAQAAPTAPTLIFPTDNQIVRPGTVPLLAQDSDVNAVDVQFIEKVGMIETVIATVPRGSGNDFAASWTVSTGGAHTIIARARDLVADGADSAAVHVSVDTTAPTLVQITSPLTGSRARR